MNNVILRKIVVTPTWQPLSESKLVASVTISTPPTNAATVLFRTKGEPTHEVPFVPGEWHDFERINLAEIEIKGTANDLVTLTGGTW